MEEGKVSVIMPVYNNDRHVGEAVRSVLAQSYTHLEIMLVDDHSTDDSRREMIALAETDDRIRCIFLPFNKGAAEARNEGIKTADGQYIAFLDTDDTWLPDKLEKQLVFIKETKAPLVFSAYRWRKESMDDGPVIKAKGKVSYSQLLYQNSIGCLTALYDRKVCGTQFMPDTKQRHDWGLWLAITRQFGPARGQNEVLAEYRTGQTSLSSNKWKAARYNWEILRKHERLGVLPASYYFLSFLINKGWKYLRLR